LLRNSGIHVNIKTVRRIMRRNSLALPYAKHKNRTRSRDLTKPENINRLWETDIHYVGTARGGMHNLILRTANGPQYISREFRETMKLLGIRSEYIQKHTPEDNGDIESFHNSLKTDYIWVTELETFEDARKLMEYAFNDYNSVRLHSSIGYLPPDEFERRLREEDGFRDKFLEDKKRKEEKRMKNRIEKKRRLKENVSLEDGISVQN
jgi:putative transposase